MKSEASTSANYPVNVHFAFDLLRKRFDYLSPELERLLQTGSMQPELGEVMSRLHSDDAAYLNKLAADLLTGKFNGMASFRIRSGADVYTLCVAPSIIDMAGRKVVIGVVQDITDETENAETISKYANKKNSILYMLGHDLRGQLNVAKTILNAAEKHLSDTNLLQQTHSVAAILESSVTMIRDLLARELLETTEVVLVRKRVDIVKVMTDYLSEYIVSPITDRKFSLTTSAREIFLDIDEGKFMQVLNNLMSNALKFTQSGDEISLKVTEEENFVRFSFADTGIGIPADKIQNLFYRHNDAGRPGLQGEPSNGLGLSIVRQIIQWHDGRIWYERNEPEGTLMNFVLPKYPAVQE